MPEVEHYSDAGLLVTSARIVFQDSTHPLSAVTGVKVAKLPDEETDRNGTAMAKGVGVFVVGAAVAVGSLLSGSFAIALLGVVAAAFGGWMVSRGWVADREDARRRVVEIRFSSGDTLSIRVGSIQKAKSIKSALDHALITSVATGANGYSLAQELERLAELRDAGVISSEDWERAKQLYLGKAPDLQAAALDQLRRLHSLHKDGVLSESEFNSKKWDILAALN